MDQGLGKNRHKGSKSENDKIDDLFYEKPRLVCGTVFSYSHVAVIIPSLNSKIYFHSYQSIDQMPKENKNLCLPLNIFFLGFLFS